MSTRLEDLLRQTMQERAQDVTTGAAWDAPPAAVAVERNRLRAWATVLTAAAAVVLAVVIGVVASRPSSKPRPAVSHPVPSPSVTPTIAPTCSATLPSAWEQALQRPAVDVSGGRSYTPLSVAPDGSVLVLRDQGPTPGSGRQIVAAWPVNPRAYVPLVNPRVLYNVPDPDQLTARIAYSDGHTMVVGIAIDNRPQKGTIPGSSVIDLQGIVAVDLSTGHSRLLAGRLDATISGPSISSLVELNGVAYWDSEASYGAPTGTLFSYPLASGVQGSARVVYRGSIGWPTATPAGVGWSSSNSVGLYLAVTGKLPDQVSAAMTEYTREELATDGTTWAWLSAPDTLGWWKPGLAAPRYVHLVTPVDTSTTSDVVLVSGDDVFLGNPVSQILDLNTGASAPMPTTGIFAGTKPAVLLYAGGGTVAGYTFGNTPGQFVDGYWADEPIYPIGIRLAGLPAITC